jgi:ABC-2 type transport system ATP-binding protein
MISFKNVTKIFNTDLFVKDFTALDNLSFDLKEGEIIGFLGANGAGKTTSLKMLMDFIRVSSGRIEYSDSLGKTQSEIFQNIGFLPERAYYYPHLTGMEFCYYMGDLTNLKKKKIKEQIEYWAPKFKIDFALNRKLRNYSKGMLQRIGFLVTLLHDPKLIILDEPLSGLDPVGRKELKDIIVDVNKSGKTVFFSSHILSDVEEICDSVIFIKKGQLVYQGSVAQIIKDNDKAVIEVRYIEKNEHKNVEIAQKDKSSFLAGLLEKDCEVISVNAKKMTLEEIFYEV